MIVKCCCSRSPDLFLSISSHKLLIYFAIVAIIMQCPCIEYGFVYIDMALLVCVCEVTFLEICDLILMFNHWGESS